EPAAPTTAAAAVVPSPAPSAPAVVTAATATIASRRTEAPAPVAAPAAATVAPRPAAKPAALGAITVVCMPKCDQIIDNGVSLGPGHIFNRPVPSGRHVLALSAPNGAKKTLVVDVPPEQTKEVRMSMDK
ncbi:MAG: hypothetical protein JWP97_776, partial [Labilithrix sp.]|nr:hypothetical protein [Labilithrix sp.]